MLKGISKVFTVSTLGKLLGFIKIQLLTRYLGASEITDAIIIVINIYWFWASGVIFPLFSNTLIPKLAKQKTKEGQINLTRKLFVNVNIASLFLLFIVIFFGEEIICLFAPQSSDLFLKYAGKLFYLLIPLVFLIPLTEIFTLLNQYNARFTISASNLIVWNTFQILGILIGYHYFDDETVLITVGILTIVAYFISSYLQLSRSNFFEFLSIKKLFNISYSGLISTIKENATFFLATVFMLLGPHVDYAFISNLQAGSITVYNIVLKVPEVIQSLLITSLSVIFFNDIVNRPEVRIKTYKRFTWGIMGLVAVSFIFGKYLGSWALELIYGDKIFSNFTQINEILLFAIYNIFLMGKIALLIRISILEKKGIQLFIVTSIGLLAKFALNSFLLEYYEMLGVISSTLITNSLVLFFLQVIILGRVEMAKLAGIDFLFVLIITGLFLI